MIPDDLSTPLPASGTYTGPFPQPTAALDTLPVPSATPYLPFAIIATSGSSATITVLPGFIGDTMDVDSSFAITDINTALSVASNSVIYLKGDVSGLSTTAITVVCDTGWTGYPALIHLDGSTPPAQDEFYVLVGYVGSVPASPNQVPGVPITISGTQYWIYQRLRNDLMIQSICADGTPSLYPFAFQGPVV